MEAYAGDLNPVAVEHPHLKPYVAAVPFPARRKSRYGSDFGKIRNFAIDSLAGCGMI